jgi:hypothetical protein
MIAPLSGDYIYPGIAQLMTRNELRREDDRSRSRRERKRREKEHTEPPIGQIYIET